jgi:hypothetical protein
MSFRAWLPSGWRKTGGMGNGDRSMLLQPRKLPKKGILGNWLLAARPHSEKRTYQELQSRVYFPLLTSRLILL